MAQWYRFGLIGWVKGCEGDKCKVVKENKDLKLEIVKLREQLLQMNSIKQENKRLNNIINELEKWLGESIEKHTEDYLDWKYDRNVYLAGSKKLQNVLDKLEELKGDDK